VDQLCHSGGAAGGGRLDRPGAGSTWHFLTSFDSRKPADAGDAGGNVGHVLADLVHDRCSAVPVGVGAAIYLEEYASDNWLTRFDPGESRIWRACLQSSTASWG
jgi:hypothetical protein